MHLTKLELQEMLREMGVKFSHNESYENLKKLFQEENHMRWMGNASSNGKRPGSGYKQVVRKRTAIGTKKMMVLSNPPVAETKRAANHIAFTKSVAETAASLPKSKRRNISAKSINPAPPSGLEKNHNVEMTQRQDVFAIVLRRAQNSCESCGHQSGSDRDGGDNLKPFHILPPAFGGEISVKNLVALCDECHRRLSTDAQPSELKQLKRRARGKIIRTIEIQRKHRL